jgi:hypothetical protein
MVRTSRRPSGIEMMTSQGTAHGRFTRAIRGGHLLNAEIAARELGALSLSDSLAVGTCRELRLPLPTVPP